MVKLFFLLIFLPFSLAHGEEFFQIIHTNDLHSFYKGERSGNGGLARLTSLSNFLINDFEGASLRLDAGDFADGTSFSIPDSGRMSFRLLDAMGIEATVIGNHDYVHGIHVLRQNILANEGTKFLAANLDSKARAILQSLVTSSHMFFKSGLKIGVIGLSTPHVLYQYQWKEGRLIHALGPLKKEITNLKNNGADVILLLSHLGLEKDLLILKQVAGLDAIIGGHSHEPLHRPLYRKDREGRRIPVFQAGAHGLFLGHIKMKINEWKTVEVIDYKLHDIDGSLLEDPLVASLVETQEQERQDFFKKHGQEINLDSSHPLEGMRNGKPGVQKNWAKIFLKRALTESGAKLAIWSNAFFGEEIPKGRVSFLDIVDNLPRVNESSHPWRFRTISATKIETLLLLNLVKRLPKNWNVAWEYNSAGSDMIVIPDELVIALQTTYPWLKLSVHPNPGPSIWDVAIKAIQD